jgi:hypothetical protein
VREARAFTEAEQPSPSVDAEFGDCLTPYLRREPRIAVDWAAELRLAAYVAAGRVVDVSLRGALVATPLRLERGARVELRIHRYAEPISGVVRHTRAGYLGLEFDVAHEAPVADASARLGPAHAARPGRLAVVR